MSARAQVEWTPAELEQVRASYRLSVPTFEAEAALRRRPEELVRLAYSTMVQDGDGAAIVLRVSPSISWLNVPASIGWRTPSPGHPGAIISLSWRARRWPRLVPELDADVSLHSVDGRAELHLEGRYRPPLGLAGLVFDHLLGRRIATQTLGDFVTVIGASIEQLPAPGGSQASDDPEGTRQ